MALGLSEYYTVASRGGLFHVQAAGAHEAIIANAQHGGQGQDNAGGCCQSKSV